MSTPKKQRMANLQKLYAQIEGRFCSHPNRPARFGWLNDITSSSADTASVVSDLHQIASLALSFSDQRFKSGNDDHLTDTLDQQGVNLWNASGLFRQDCDSRAIVAACFRLMEAGLEAKPSIEALLHMLQIASKTGSTLSGTTFHLMAGVELGNSESAASVLISAAKYEEALRNHDDPDRTHQLSKARVTTLYFSSRMEAVRLSSPHGVMALILIDLCNEGLATFMADKRELLATKLLDIGKSILRTCHQGGKLITEGNRAPDALRWMQKAFQVIEPLACTSSPELAELKRSVLRSLARGYFLASSQDPENLTRAEVALDEVISTIDSSIDHTSSEYQQLRWMKLAVVKRRKAGDTELLQAYSKSFAHYLTTSKHSGDSHTKAMNDLEAAFQGESGFREACKIAKSDVELSKAAVNACLTLTWQYGDHHYHASHWTEAADWFMCGTHPIFAGLGSSSSSKCLRKAALCYIQQKEYAKAAFAIKRCPKNATRAVREMAEATDFDRRMLLLACRLAHDSDMKSLLLSVLMALLDTLNFRDNVENLTEGMTLIRCIIRLTLKLLGQPDANQSSLVQTLLSYFKNAKILVEAVPYENVALVIRDLSWLWRTAYNCAIEGCSNWDNHSEEVSEAFDIARQLLELYISRTLTEVEPSTYLYIANASFAATSGRVIWARERLSGSQGAEVGPCKARTTGLLEKVLPDDRSHLLTFLHFLRVFYVETESALGEWSSVLEMIEEATRADDQALITFEAIGDILAILHACLAHNQLSLDKFSRWMRSICSILLSKGTESDRSKAIQYFDQASAVLEEHGSLVENGNPLYPIDERLWLLSTAYNTGVECLHASVVDKAKRWFECATVICRFVPDGKARAEKISETYTELLARYKRG
ncbi:hypothetical protein V8B97DRAFT_2024035 [Scleroderma yunnanense]